MGTFVPLHNHSHFSLLNGVTKPKQMASRCVELGYTSCGLTDNGNIGCAVQFVSAMKGKGIKPILGCELYGPDLAYIPVLAKNFAGWKSLISISSFSHNKENFDEYPRISLPKIGEMANGNLIAFSGHPGSDLANALFEDPKAAYAQTDYKTITSDYVRKDWVQSVRKVANEYIDCVGRENFFIGIQNIDPENNPVARVVADGLRYLSRKDGIQRVAIPNSYYPRQEDAPDQRVLLCSSFKTTMKEMFRRAHAGDGRFRYNFTGNQYHIPSTEEMRVWNDEEEIANSVRISDMCEEYDILHNPILPMYPCPDGLNPDQYLSSLCKAGWDSKVYARVDEDKWGEYTQRVRKELGVIKEAGLASYFLIVQDYCNWARRQGMIVGPGRGSGAGCLVSYLIGITSVDPIELDLIFERFYNAGRNAPGHISLPDIDCDFPVSRRKEIVAYLKSKYGDDKVANIATFNSLKGRSALTEVLRAQDVPFSLVKQITATMPEEARISEELQVMRDRGEDPSIIRYTLESDPDTYKDWCVMHEDEDSEGHRTYRFEGEYAPYFAQAVRLEGTKRNISMHAAGVVLASTPLADMCPLVYDADIDGYLAGMEYPDLEKMGQVKLDILGVSALEKIMGCRSLLRFGYINPEDAN